MERSTPDVEGGQNTRPLRRPSRVKVAAGCLLAIGLGTAGLASSSVISKPERDKPASTETIRNTVAYLRSLPSAEGIACPDGQNPPKFQDGRRLCFSLLNVQFESVPDSSARVVVPLTSERADGYLNASMAETVANNPEIDCIGPREALRDAIKSNFTAIPGLAADEYIPFRIVFDGRAATRCDDPGPKPVEITGIR